MAVDKAKQKRRRKTDMMLEQSTPEDGKSIKGTNIGGKKRKPLKNNGITDSDDVILIERIIEYAIFSSSVLTISFAYKPDQKYNFLVNDIGNETFIAEPTVDTISSQIEMFLSNTPLKATMSYKNHSLVFSTFIKGPYESKDPEVRGKKQFVFHAPKTGKLINNRKYIRFPLTKEGESLKATLKIDGKIGKWSSTTQEVVNYSQNSIALFLNRADGLALPPDKIERLSLYYKENMVLDTSGEVIRIDMHRRHSSMERSYMAVIQFSDNPKNRKKKGKGEYKRNMDRAYVFDYKGSFLEFDHPVFQNYHAIGQLVDISPSGISFLADEIKFPIIPGMILGNLEIQLPYASRYTVSLKVLHCQRSRRENDQYSYLIGGEFLGVSVEFHKVISRLISQKLGSPQIVDANSEDYKQLWEFFFETGFIYQQKRQYLQKHASKLFKTYTQLLNSDTPILKNILFKDSDQIKGHLSAVRFFDSAWMVQHLNALWSTNKETIVPAILNAMVNFFMDPHANKKMETHFILFYYRPNNFYASMLFGEAKEQIGNTNICDIQELDYCLLKSDAVIVEEKKEIATEHDDLDGFEEEQEEEGVDDIREMQQMNSINTITCHEATYADLERLERVLIDAGEFNLMRIEGLSMEKFTQIDIAKEYENLGLYRYRKVFAAYDASMQHSAFAVCNYASPGVNLSELTNSFRIFYTTNNTEMNVHLATKLADKVIESFKNTEMPSVVLLKKQNDPTPMQFKRVRKYCYWYHDTDYMSELKEAVNDVFKNMGSLAKKYRQKKSNEQIA